MNLSTRITIMNRCIRLVMSVAAILLQTLIQAQSWQLQNGQIHRQFVLRQDSFFTQNIHLKSDSLPIIRPSKDFSFLVNDQVIDGFSGWNLEKTEREHDTSGVEKFRFSLHTLNPDLPLRLAISYTLYPELPVIRKQLHIENTGNADLKLEGIQVEALETTLEKINSVVYHNYGRMKHLMRYEGDWDDPVIVVHDHRKQKGIALGNEAMGIIKRTTFHTQNNNIEIGLTQPDHDFPFRKWLSPGENWSSPHVFICPYNDTDDGFAVINHTLQLWQLRHQRPRILTLKEKPTFVYNTWNPFRTFVSDSLIRSVAKAAADCGIEEFIIDDGWQVNAHGQSSIRGWGENYGDWLVDSTKFPDGLKPVFDYIKSLGMKPGLWISIASATKDSKVYQEHPEWFVQNQSGNPGNLHYASSQDDGFYSASFGTEWVEHIKQVILGLVKEHGLAYAKLDLAVVSSPYLNDDQQTGSYATDHPYYRDRPESFGVFYERLLDFFDELHAAAPDLFIDCTFETAGKLHLMDYAIAQHAEGNWLSNFEEQAPLGPLRVRQMAWWRSPALPASSLVIGNLTMDDPNFELSLKSLLGTLPIVLGDPRKLDDNQRSRIKAWADWMKKAQERHDYMAFRKDLSGFGEPREGHWDGWQRINFETRKGGIVGVFRQGAREQIRRIFLDDLSPEESYHIRQAPDGKLLMTTSGQELMERGFSVEIDEDYGGRIFEVEIVR